MSLRGATAQASQASLSAWLGLCQGHHTEGGPPPRVSPLKRCKESSTTVSESSLRDRIWHILTSKDAGGGSGQPE